MKTITRFLAALKKIAAILVIILCLIMLIGAWVSRPLVSSAAIRLLTSVEKSADAMRNSVEMAENRVVALGKQIGSVEQAIEEFAQDGNKNDQAEEWLSEDMELQMVATSHSIRDITHNLRQLLSGYHELLKAINSLPFIQLTIPGQDRLVGLDKNVDRLWIEANVLKSNMTSIRSGESGSNPQAIESIREMRNLLHYIQSELDALDEQFVKIVSQAGNIKSVVRKWINLLLILVIMILVWMIYSQIVIIRQALSAFPAHHIDRIGKNSSEPEQLKIEGDIASK